MQLKQWESHPQVLSLWGSHSGPLSTCPNQLRARYQGVRNSPCAPEMLKVFKVGNPKPAYPVSPVPSWENHSIGICPVPPTCSLGFLTNPGASLCASPLISWHALSWELWVINYLFTGNCLLICWSLYYLNTPYFRIRLKISRVLFQMRWSGKDSVKEWHLQNQNRMHEPC